MSQAPQARIRAGLRKGALLCSTCLISAVATPGSSRAEFEATVGGTWNTAYGFVQQDDGDGDSGDGVHNQALNQDWVRES